MSKYKITKNIKYPVKALNKFIIKNITFTRSNLIANEKELIDNILKDFRLSVTALNTYLDCPYKFKLNNLYRIPTAKKPYFSFGTAVHKALEKFHKKYQSENQLPPKRYLLDQFKSALTQELLTTDELKERLLQGKRFLNKYFDLHQPDLKPALYIEKFFGTSSSPLVLDNIFLTGKIDRIDIIRSKNKTVKVIDYKTGKKKTRGQIEGATADQNGALKRQLIFYKLLVSLDPTFPHKVAQAELDFIQSPKETGKSGKEVFHITNKDVQELKTVIKKSYKKIKNYQFNRTVDHAICHRCEFKNHCWPTGTPQTQKQN